MTKRLNKQLELPILADVNSSMTSKNSASLSVNKSQFTQPDSTGFHKPASKEDQSIYRSISDSYFSTATKY